MGRPSGLLLSISALLAAVLSPAAAAKNGSTLFKGGTIIAFNEKKQDLDIIRGGSLLISDGIVSAITEGAYDKPLPPGTEIVDATGDILTPGFIDTHRHGWQTAYRTIGSNTTLAEYFNRYGEFAADGIWFWTTPTTPGLRPPLMLVSKPPSTVVHVCSGALASITCPTFLSSSNWQSSKNLQIVVGSAARRAPLVLLMTLSILEALNRRKASFSLPCKCTCPCIQPDLL